MLRLGSCTQCAGGHETSGVCCCAWRRWLTQCFFHWLRWKLPSAFSDGVLSARCFWCGQHPGSNFFQKDRRHGRTRRPRLVISEASPHSPRGFFLALSLGCLVPLGHSPECVWGQPRKRVRLKMSEAGWSKAVLEAELLSKLSKECREHEICLDLRQCKFSTDRRARTFFSVTISECCKNLCPAWSSCWRRLADFMLGFLLDGMKHSCTGSEQSMPRKPTSV